MPGDRRLTEGQWESMMRMAQHTASTTQHAPALTIAEKYDVALDAIVAWAAGNDWPESDFGPVFRAASNAVAFAGREAVKHLAYRAHWVAPPSGEDVIGEAVTDRIGIRQAMWCLTEREWLAVWAMAEAIRRGEPSLSAGAAIAGLDPVPFIKALQRARAKVRRVWVAAGERPARPYHARGSKAANARCKRNSKAIRLWKESP